MKMDPGERNLGSEAVTGSIAKVSLLAVGFLGSIVFARVLGPRGFGAFYLLVALENLADRPIAGFADSVKKRFTEHDSDTEKLFGAFSVAFVIFAGAVVILAILGSEYIQDFVGVENAAIFFLLLFLSLSMQDTFNTLLAATGRVGLVHGIDAIRSVVTILLQVGLILLGLGVAGMTYGLAGSSITTALMILWILRIAPRKPDLATFRSLWEFAKFSVPSSVTMYGYGKAGFLLIGWLLGPAVAGYFEAAQKLTIPALLLGGMASGVLMPQVSQMSSRGMDVTRKVSEVMSYTSILAIPMLFGAVALSEKIVITVYGSEFAPAAMILIGYTFYRFFETRIRPLRSAFEGIDRPEYVFYMTAIAGVFLVVIGIPLLLEYGAEGMILAMVIVEGFRYMIGMIFVRRELSIPWFPKQLRLQLSAGFVMFLVIEGVKTLVGLGRWYVVFLVVGFGAIIYLGILFAISKDLRRTSKFVLHDFVHDKFPSLIQ